MNFHGVGIWLIRVAHGQHDLIHDPTHDPIKISKRETIFLKDNSLLKQLIKLIYWLIWKKCYLSSNDEWFFYHFFHKISDEIQHMVTHVFAKFVFISYHANTILDFWTKTPLVKKHVRCWCVCLFTFKKVLTLNEITK